ncbi:MAG: copper amine oxidase N-terminal domain-containing protein [Bacillota bacterium]|nr:copper amine oxidase N-terminal domain-containing protein [Bacillota bacterium]
MKKLLSVISVFLVAVMLSGIGVKAAGNDKVEIKFKVGDSALLINGVKTEVETPYVAGEGTTLVPLRVITEAFGAEVNWEQDSKTIKLKYSDVNIKMQIGSSDVMVNTHTEKLTQAPVLSPNGVTMVPLRFISETFGASVSFDKSSNTITVVKEELVEGSTVTGLTDKSKVGDSYYGWSMNTPKDMFMDDRSFDGLETVFHDKNEAKIDIDIYLVDKDLSFDKDFADIKDSFKGYTLIKADKLTDSAGNRYMHFQAKDKEKFFDYKHYYKNNLIFDIETEAKPDAGNLQTLVELSDSFLLGFGDKENTYDLSNVDKDGYRTFKSEAYKVSLKVPSDWMDISDDTENKFSFSEFKLDSYSNIYFSVYSKSDKLTAESLATGDHNENIKYPNKKYASVTDVAEYEINKEIKGFAYELTTSGTKSDDGILTDIFFEKGDYIYNITFDLKNDNKELISNVLSSLTVDELDKNKVGVLLRNDYEKDATYVTKFGNWSLTMPMLWTEANDPTNEGGAYVHKSTQAALCFSTLDAGNVTASDLKDFVVNQCDTIHKSSDSKLEEDYLSEKIGNITYYHYCYSREVDGEKVYCTVYVGISNKKVYTFTIMEPEVIYGGVMKDEIKGIISSITVK